MQYLDQEVKVVYASNDGKSIKVFPALERRVNLCSHIPNSSKQTVRCYRFATLSETIVQLATLTSNPNRKLLISRCTTQLITIFPEWF